MRSLLHVLLFCAVALPLHAQTPVKYEVGGPLAGEILPLYPTQHGEPPGRPGCLLNEQGGFIKGPDGQYPELQLYPGSVEHFRSYMYKYMPVRFMFDRQSQLKNFMAKDLPGVSAGQVEQYAEPVYHVSRGNAASYMKVNNAPVPVVRCKPGAPVFRIDLGRLEPGLYAVRVIGAVETKSIDRHRKPIYLKAVINDGLDGGTSTYRQRIGYVDEFYSVAEVYFHAPAAREYRVELCADQGSLVDLLVHNITLDNALAGCEVRAIKLRPTTFDIEERQLQRAQAKAAQVKPLSSDDRLKRDAMLWEAMPPINSQCGVVYGMGGDDPKANWPHFGAMGQDPDAIEKQHGKWVSVPLGPVLMKNTQLKLEYTLADLAARKPLPSPYPFKDDGCGVFTPSTNGGAPQNWIPVARAVHDRIRACETAIMNVTKSYHETGNVESARDGAVLLARYAYDFPSMDPATALSAMMVQPGAYWRDLRCRQRDQQAYWMNFYSNDINLVEAYDKLFDYIKGNEELAASVRRFVPWVQSSQDLVKLFDAYLVQNEAKHIMRYNYHTGLDTMAMAATVMNDAKVTGPWMEWLFSRTWSYPLVPCGLQEIVTTNMDRNGAQNIGSFFYAQGENAANYCGEKMELYALSGGDPRFDMRDTRRYPKIVASTYFTQQGLMAGLYHCPIGDVTGPEKGRGNWFDSEGWKKMARLGWRWTKDPGFAYMIKNYYGRTTETDEAWAALEQAAASQKRAPWMTNRSRFFPNWAGILESGTQSDDFRFRQAVMLRLGCGSGHSHADAMDLQFFAHGTAATCDGGQRGGYTTPGDSLSRVHNRVEIDGADSGAYGWLNSFADAEGARYMMGECLPQQGVTYYRRQVALIDADPGRPSPKPLTPADMLPTAKLDPDVVTPNAYVFDVSRVDGGKLHTFCFHGYVADEVQTNMDNRRPGDKEPYLKDFPLPEQKFAGTTPDVLKATWQVSRQFEKNAMLKACFDDKSPPKFTRLYLLGHKGDLAMQATQRCNQLKYDLTHVFVQRKGEDNIQGVYPAIIESSVGPSFIRSVRLLDVPGNETDAGRAVVVEVKTVNDHTDLCFADGKPDATRKIAAPFPLTVSGEFAFYSADKDGFRQATLAGGTTLSGPDAALTLAARQRTARVVKVDYLEKKLWLDQRWQMSAPRGRVIEVGLPENRTSYTLAAVADEDGKSVLTVQGGADAYMAPVTDVRPDTGEVVCGMGKAATGGRVRSWTATDGDMRRFWRADLAGGSREQRAYTIKLSGAPVRKEDFPEGSRLRLWEYGPGDTARQNTCASLRRIERGIFELTADSDVTVALKGSSIEKSPAGQTAWQPVKSKTAQGMVECALSLADLGPDGVILLRVR